jgi:hypothetical protein
MPEFPQAVGDLRPLGLGELLDRTFTLYRNNFWLFCGIMALPEAVTVLANLVFNLMTRNSLRPFMTAPNPSAPPDPRAVFSQIGAIFGYASIITIVRLVIYAAAVAATTLAVAAVYLGQRATIRDAYRKIRARLGAVIGLFIMLGLITLALLVVAETGAIIGAVAAGAALSFISPVLAGVIAVILVFGAIIGAAWLLMRFSLALPVILLEDRGVIDSMARSGQLTQGHRGRIFLGLVIVGLITFAISAAITAPSSVLLVMMSLKGSFLPAWLVIAQSLSAGIAGTLTGPLLSIALALLYYDVRIRKEAFDLEAMLAASPVPPQQPPSMPPPMPPAMPGPATSL